MTFTINPKTGEAIANDGGILYCPMPKLNKDNSAVCCDDCCPMIRAYDPPPREQDGFHCARCHKDTKDCMCTQEELKPLPGLFEPGKVSLRNDKNEVITAENRRYFCGLAGRPEYAE
jgi:hypothetical protein